VSGIIRGMYAYGMVGYQTYRCVSVPKMHAFFMNTVLQISDSLSLSLRVNVLFLPFREWKDRRKEERTGTVSVEYQHIALAQVVSVSWIRI